MEKIMEKGEEQGIKEDQKVYFSMKTTGPLRLEGILLPSECLLV